MRPERKTCQHGQALIEALLGCALLLLLLLAVVVLGKYHAADLASTQAARQLVFNCGYQPEACELDGGQAPGSDHWKQRLLGRAPVDYFHAPLWVSAQGKAMLGSEADIDLHVSRNAFDAMPGVAARGPALGSTGPVETISRLAGPGKFGLDIRAGLVTSHARLRLFASQQPGSPDDILRAMPLQPAAGASLLTDAWNASGPYGGRWSVHARVDQGWRIQRRADQVIRAGYAGTKIFIRAMNLLFLEEQANEFKHGEIPMDLVPVDRLASTPGRAH